MNTHYKTLSQKYIDEILVLVINAYKEEQEMINYLPDKDYSKILKEKIVHLIDHGIGIVALEEGKVIGFLAGYEIDALWGKCKGIYSPLYGHGAKKDNRKAIYQGLYKKASGIWVEKSIFNHAITLYAQDQVTIDTWFWLGFGLRCVDAIRQTQALENRNLEMTIKKAQIKDIPSLVSIDKLHNLYYKSSPIFMPVDAGHPEKDLTKWLKTNHHHLWIAYDQEEVVGYMRIEPTGERFIVEDKDVMNITGAYINQAYRGKAIGVSLLDTIQKWLDSHNYPLCGVDYESFNISGSNFWQKYFTPYTYSVVRRIDERVIDQK